MARSAPRAMPSSALCASAWPKKAMRRQTTKQPSGPASAATPTPPRIARTMKSSSMARALAMWRFLRGRFLRHDLAGEIVGMVVLVRIDREARGRARAEQRHVLGVAAHRLGPARAADVAIEADHAIGRRHHDVQVVADQQHAAAAPVADLLDQPVQLDLAGEIQ